MKIILLWNLHFILFLFILLASNCSTSSIEDAVKAAIEKEKNSSTSSSTDTCRVLALQIDPDDGSGTPAASPISCNYNSDTILHSCYFIPDSETTVLHFSSKLQFIAEGLILGQFTRNKKVYTKGATTITSYYKYDANNRLTGLTSSDGENIIYSSWDDKGRPLSGALFKTDCNEQEIAITYEGLVITSVKSSGTGSACSDETIKEEYDKNFNLIKKTVTTTSDTVIDYNVLATSKICP